MKQKPNVVAIVGPTASGKTSLSIKLAQEFNGEVISADSRQVYRGLDIGTGKVTSEEMAGVQHHLLDVADPAEAFTAIDFVRLANAAIEDIGSRNHLPIIAGGTFFYLDVLRGKLQAAPVAPNEAFRATLAKYSNQELLQLLTQQDPRRANSIDPHNRRRLERALEIVHTLGAVPEPQEAASPYSWLILCVDIDKATLLEKFKARIITWLQIGFKEEVLRLEGEGITETQFREFGFEYTLMREHLQGRLTEEELIEAFIQKNWQYAKRQLTWMKRDEDIVWVEPGNFEEISRLTRDFLS